MIEFTDSTFNNDVLNSGNPVVVDFWAPWCGPCKMLTPILEDVAREYGGSVKIGKINVDENPIVASRYGIVSIPTILFIKDGEVVDQKIGMMSKSDIKSKIDTLI